MAEFSATDAAFTGFRVVRERPWAVAIWAALLFAYSLGHNLFIAFTAGPAFTQLSQPETQMRAMQSQQALMGAFALYRQAAPTAVAVFTAFLVLVAMLTAAMNRAVTRPDQSRFGYLRLAADELRQLALLGMLVLLGLGVFWVVVVVAAVVVQIAGGAAGITGAMAAAPLMDLAMLVALALVAVRLSLASPMTFAAGRVALFQSWILSRRRFWRLTGAYAMALALAIIVSLLVGAIELGALAAVGGQAALATVQRFDWSSLGAVLSVPRLVDSAISSIGWALVAPIVLCPPIAIYRALSTNGAL